MKLWFELVSNYVFDDSNVYVGIMAYKHKRKEWEGWTVGFIFFSHMLQLNYVNNYEEYDKIINRRYRCRLGSRNSTPKQ